MIKFNLDPRNKLYYKARCLGMYSMTGKLPGFFKNVFSAIYDSA